MQLLICAGLILLGFVFGYFLKTALLVIISIVSVVIGVSWLKSAQEIEGLLAVAFAVCAVIANIAMWVTWYVINDQNFVQVFIHNYILR